MLPFIAAMIRVHDAQLQSSNNIRPSLPRNDRTSVLEARSWLDSLLVSLLGPSRRPRISGLGRESRAALRAIGADEENLMVQSLTSANLALGLLIAGVTEGMWRQDLA